MAISGAGRAGSDAGGCCHGSCTHVWNYAQAFPHLFPQFERGLRDTEFDINQDERGHQVFRSLLPPKPITDHSFHAASDGQLGGIVKVYREWRISGDTDWLRGLWPKIRQSLLYCIETWDPEHEGWLAEPHHNTYDIEFWGPDGICTGFYLAALVAATRMAEALDEDSSPFNTLTRRSRKRMEEDLFNGDYFYQQTRWKGLKATKMVVGAEAKDELSPEVMELLEREGPRYQYGNGCMSDGVIGAWLAEACGVGEILDPDKVTSHLLCVYNYNLKHDLSEHANAPRPGFAVGNEGGLLVCTWPKGGMPSLPMFYSHEVWTGIEYQVAAHLIVMRRVEEGLDIVRTARARYDGRVRNPFNEYECGSWYARAMSSYALLQALSGARYDAIDKVLYLHPKITGDFKSFLCTASGFGTAGVRNGEPFLDVKSGSIPVERIDYQNS